MILVIYTVYSLTLADLLLPTTLYVRTNILLIKTEIESEEKSQSFRKRWNQDLMY